MKLTKILTSLFLGVLTVCLFNFADNNVANAGPAPALTSAKFISVQVEGNKKLPVTNGKVQCPTPLNGQFIDIVVKFTGYPNQNTTFIRQAGGSLKKTIVSNLSSKVGFETTYRIKKSDICGGYVELTIDSQGVNGGRASDIFEGLRLVP